MIPVYFEAAAVITVLVLLGQVLELRARERTGSAIRALLRLAPKTAQAHPRGWTATRRCRSIRCWSATGCASAPARRCPSTASVTEGNSAVDESMVTGESMPVGKEPGARLIGGTINGTGALLMRAEQVGSRHVLARIVHMVAEAQRSRAPIQRLADIVVRMVRAGGHCWPHCCRSSPGWRGARARACVRARQRPCPWSSSPARARSAWPRRCPSWSASAGAPLLACCIRNAEALERMEKVDTLVVDKTGTLTEGRPQVVAVAAGDRIRREPTVLRAARASLEQLQRASAGRGHRRRRRRQRGIAAAPTSADFESVTGKGVMGHVDGPARGASATRRLLEDLHVSSARRWSPRADALRRDGAHGDVRGRRWPAGRRDCASPIRSRRRRREALATSAARGRAGRDAHGRQSHHGRRPSRAARHR